MIFAKRLAMLVKAGVPLLQALRILKKQMRSRGVTEIFNNLITDIENGQFLSISLGRYRRLFGDFAINIIRVGEESGTLAENLAYLADELNKKQTLRRKVIGALVYPIFIILATFGITGLLMLYVFPRILPIFQSLKFELPLTTRVLIWVSNFVSHNWLWLLLGLSAAITIFLLLLRINRFRFWVHRLTLAIPLLGRLAQSYQMANICRTMGILLKSNVMIVEATNIAASTTLNAVYRKELYVMAEKARKGSRLSEHMELRSHLFPPMISQMVGVGEISGNLNETLLFLADMYEQEVDELTRNLTTVLEPALMIFMGLIVGFLAISIITPIYGITQNIHP